MFSWGERGPTPVKLEVPLMCKWGQKFKNIYFEGYLCTSVYVIIVTQDLTRAKFSIFSTAYEVLIVVSSFKWEKKEKENGKTT